MDTSDSISSCTAKTKEGAHWEEQTKSIGRRTRNLREYKALKVICTSPSERQSLGTAPAVIHVKTTAYVRQSMSRLMAQLVMLVMFCVIVLSMYQMVWHLECYS